MICQAGEQTSDDCGLKVSVTEIDTRGGRLVESVHCTYECHQDTRLSLDYELISENWAGEDGRLPRIRNLSVDFSSVEHEDNLVVRGEVTALQEYCKVLSLVCRIFHFLNAYLYSSQRHCDLYSAFTALDSYLSLSEARSNVLADLELPTRPDGGPSVKMGGDCLEVAFTSDNHGHLAVLEWRMSFDEQGRNSLCRNVVWSLFRRHAVVPNSCWNINVIFHSEQDSAHSTLSNADATSSAMFLSSKPNRMTH